MKPALVVTSGGEYDPHPRRVKMTATLAEKILDRNTMNRPLRPGRAERYARDMRAGRWTMNGATIVISRDGQLLDGQHRLWAVVEAAKDNPKFTIEMLVVEGIDASTFPTIDTGWNRKSTDVFAIAGSKNNTTLTAALRWLWWYEQKPRPARPSDITVTHAELLAFFEGNPDFADAAAVVGSTKNARRIVTQSVLCFAYAMAARIDASRAGAWLSLVNTGEGLDHKHPVLQLRERLLANKLAAAKLPALDVCALTVKSWNQFVTGKRTATLRWATTEPFPEFATPRR